MADLNGDGRDDIYVGRMTSDGLTDGSDKLYISDVPDSSGHPQMHLVSVVEVVSSISYAGFSPTWIEVGETTDMAAGDFNSDGLMDFIITRKSEVGSLSSKFLFMGEGMITEIRGHIHMPLFRMSHSDDRLMAGAPWGSHFYTSHS
eukprot:SAG31_NODE_8819_length_1382_cov_1.246298_1_plen_146_part_10